MNITFKPGVECTGVNRRIFIAILTACEIWYHQLGEDLTVTSLCDGKHGKDSLHYPGLAVDLRTRDNDSPVQWTTEIKNKLRDELYHRLPPGYDIVVERDHIHIEWDPK